MGQLSYVAILLALPLLYGCCPDEIFDREPEKIGFRVTAWRGNPSVKGSVPADRSQIEDVNLYIFNSAGERVFYNYYPDNNLLVEDLPVFTKEKYTLYLLANWGGELPVSVHDDISNLKYVPDDPCISDSGDFPEVMSGILGDVYLGHGKNLDVEMEKLYAKVVVKCDYKDLGSQVDLAVESMGVRNIPKETSVFGCNAASEVVEGKTYGVEDIDAQGEGFCFFMLENIQGGVGGARNNKMKASLLSPERRSVCSYVEMVCNLVTPEHRGKMTYRFYLGSAHDNCNVERNTVQEITVAFKGNASENEYSVSVDNSALLDRVTRVDVVPAFIAFNHIPGMKHKCRATVFPESAFDKSLVWHSSNRDVAVVDDQGCITIIGPGECRIYAISVENPAARGEVEIMVIG